MSKRQEPLYLREGRAAANSRLKVEDVFWIRENEGVVSVWEMAQRFGVAQSTIRKVLNWETFQHLEGGGGRTGQRVVTGSPEKASDDGEVAESLSRLLGDGEVKVEKQG